MTFEEQLESLETLNTSIDFFNPVFARIESEIVYLRLKLLTCSFTPAPVLVPYSPLNKVLTGKKKVAVPKKRTVNMDGVTAVSLKETLAKQEPKGRDVVKVSHPTLHL